MDALEEGLVHQMVLPCSYVEVSMRTQPLVGGNFLMSKN